MFYFFCRGRSTAQPLFRPLLALRTHTFTLTLSGAFCLPLVFQGIPITTGHARHMGIAGIYFSVVLCITWPWNAPPSDGSPV